MNKKVYVILVYLKHGEMGTELSAVSQEGYDSIEKAQNFCKNREDGQVIPINPMTFESLNYEYRIKEISIK